MSGFVGRCFRIFLLIGLAARASPSRAEESAPVPVEAAWPAGAQLAPPQGHLAKVTCLAFSPDGRLLLSGSSDQMLLLWDVKTGEIVRRLEGHAGWVHACVFLPDGRTAVSGGWGGEVIVWDLERGREVRRLEGFDRANCALSLAVRADGGEVLAGSVYGAVRGWNPRTGQTTLEERHDLSKNVWSVGYTRGGTRFAGGSSGDGMVVWDGDEIRKFEHDSAS